MASDPGEGIYRAMVEARGMPKLGAGALTLGIRKGKDIAADTAGTVQRPTFQPGAENGLSCAPTILDLPRFALPVGWGGSNKRTVLWHIDEVDLGPDLVAQEDTVPGQPKRHVSVGPAGLMSFDEFVRLIEATQSKWKKVTKN